MGLVVVMCGDAQVHAGVVFQQIDVEDDQGDNGTTSLRMFGVTKVCSSFFNLFFSFAGFFFFFFPTLQEGHSVMAYIMNFQPYFYVPAPRGFLENDIRPFKDALNVSIC